MKEFEKGPLYISIAKWYSWFLLGRFSLHLYYYGWDNIFTKPSAHFTDCCWFYVDFFFIEVSYSRR